MKIVVWLAGLLIAGSAWGQNSNNGNTNLTPVSQIVAGSGVTVSPSSGTGVVTVSASGGGGGTVTFVGLTNSDGSITVSGSPVTTSGNIGVSVGNVQCSSLPALTGVITSSGCTVAFAGAPAINLANGTGLPLSGLASQSPATVIGNCTGSPGIPTACTLGGDLSVSGGVLSSGGGPQTAAEATAGVTPSNTLYFENDIRRYGATGTGEDDTTAWNNLSAVAAVNGRPVQLSGLSLTFANGLTYSYIQFEIMGQGATLSFPTLASSTCAVTFVASGYGNFEGYTYGLINFTLNGPGYTTGTSGICFGPTSGSSGGAFALIDNFQISGFGYGLNFNGNNAWAQRIGSGTLKSNMWAIYMPSGTTNSSESITFDSISASNNVNGIYNYGNNMHFAFLTLDYNLGRDIDAEGGGTVRVTDCHIESSYDTDYWLYETGSGSFIYLDKCEFHLSSGFTGSAPKKNYPIGYGPTSSGGGGIYFGEVNFNGFSEVNYSFNYAVQGGGSLDKLSALNQVSSSGTTAVLSHSALSILSDGGFGKSYIVDPLSIGYQTTGASQAAISSALYFNGAHTGFIAAGGLGTITGGSGYTNGYYSGVPLTNVSGSGSGAIGNITISGGAVTAVTIANSGAGYAASNTLSASASNLGGTGSGFSVPISTIGSISQSVFSDTQSMVQAPASGNRAIELYQMRLTPGSIINFCGRLASSSASTADDAFINFAFYDENGNAINTNNVNRAFVLSSLTANTWYRFCTLPYGGAPAGTKYAQVYVAKQSSGGGGGDGIGSVYWDDLYLTISNGQGSMLSAGEWIPVNGASETAAFSLNMAKGTAIDGIQIRETSGNAATTAISIGTTSGGSDVLASQAIAANGEYYLPCGALLKCYSSSNGRWYLYFTTPTPAHINVTVIPKRILTQGY